MRIPIHRLRFQPTLSHRAKIAPRGWHGYCEVWKRLIVLDPRSPQLLSTYLHELLHLSYPGWTEREVHREEKRMWKKLTWKDKAHLAQALGKGRCG